MSESVQASLKELRWDYASDTLHRRDLADDPLQQFSAWFEDAISANLREPNAMTLSTVGLDGCPTARTVLMKEYTGEGISFFTNYASRKGREIATTPAASLLFFWKELERQVQVRGHVEKVSAAESDAYYYSRPYNSRIGAWASLQSEEIPDRNWLSERVREYEEKYPETEAEDCVPRPEFWGGYRLIPETVEFWQGQPARKHDRFVYRREGDGWTISRWSP